MKIGFIGCGKMAKAIISALVAAKVCKAGEIIASDANSERLKLAKKELRIKAARNNLSVSEKSDTIVIAVKPQNVEDVLKEISQSAFSRHLIISIAAGISTAFIEKNLKNARVVRVMPNVGCLVGEAASAYAPGGRANASDKKTVEKIFGSCGRVVEVKEEMLDAVTALSGSGPAFLAEMLDAMAAAGTEKGLSKEDAYMLALQTFFGTAKLMKDKKISPQELVEMVASKGGTTEAGLKVMGDSNFRKVISEVIDAAFKRSRELGK